MRIWANIFFRMRFLLGSEGLQPVFDSIPFPLMEIDHSPWLDHDMAAGNGVDAGDCQWCGHSLPDRIRRLRVATFGHLHPIMSDSQAE